MKTIKKINLFVTIVSLLMFLIGNSLQLNYQNKVGSMQIGLNWLTYIATIVLCISLIAWLLFSAQFVFYKLNFDNLVVRSVLFFLFLFSIPWLLSLITFVIYDLLNYGRVYLRRTDFFEDSLANTVYKYVLCYAQSELTFWLIFTAIFSVFLGIVIFRDKPEKE